MCVGCDAAAHHLGGVIRLGRVLAEPRFVLLETLERRGAAVSHAHARDADEGLRYGPRAIPPSMRMRARVACVCLCRGEASGAHVSANF